MPHYRVGHRLLLRSASQGRCTGARDPLRRFQRKETMRIAFKRVATWILLLACGPGITWAQNATTKRAVGLRRDPSTTAPVVAHLAKGDRLMLVQTTADSGFYHVETEHDQIGWVASKYVALLQPSPLPPAPPPITTPIPP